MRRYTKTKVIRITETQHSTLKKMKSLNVDVGRFIREAIAEKIQREKQHLLEVEEETDPFLIELNQAICNITKTKNSTMLSIL